MSLTLTFNHPIEERLWFAECPEFPLETRRTAYLLYVAERSLSRERYGLITNKTRRRLQRAYLQRLQNPEHARLQAIKRELWQ